MTKPILMEEAFWANSQFSVARYSGGISFNGEEFQIVNKHGITLFELSDPASKHYVGDDKKAIEPGEPADLVQVKWIPIYQKLGREKFIELIKQNVNLKEAERRINDGII